jgi:hypothetical protein
MPGEELKVSQAGLKKKRSNIRMMKTVYRIDAPMECGSVEFRSILREACPPVPGEQMKHWLYRLGNVLGIGAARAESIYYHPKCRLSPAEADRVNAALARHIQAIRHEADILEARQGAFQHETAQQLHALLSEALSLLPQPSAFAAELQPALVGNAPGRRRREMHRARRLSAA